MCSMTRRNEDKGRKRKTRVVRKVERQRDTTTRTVRISACRHRSIDPNSIIPCMKRNERVLSNNRLRLEKGPTRV